MTPREVPDAALYGLPVAVTCPFCEHADTELHSPFGPQLSVATYWCRRCFTAFDYLKWQGRQPGSADRSGTPRQPPEPG